MQPLALLQFLSGLLLTAAFPQHTSSRHRRDLQILTPPTDQSQPLYPSLSEPYPLAAHQFEPSPEFLLSSSFPPDTTLSINNPPSILNPEPSIDTIYCNDKKVLVCCPQQISKSAENTGSPTMVFCPRIAGLRPNMEPSLASILAVAVVGFLDRLRR